MALAVPCVGLLARTSSTVLLPGFSVPTTPHGRYPILCPGGVLRPAEVLVERQEASTPLDDVELRGDLQLPQANWAEVDRRLVELVEDLRDAGS